ncbi:MAG: hypothetical protein JNM78_03985 [Cyclobacteriaceae bacterium]|nr:hypothetical protein [Cyclobacteriaceae bacterium]
MPQTRQLAAIMFTDIVGYTTLMGKDEHKAFALLNKNRQLQKPIIESFGGRWIKEMGDGVIASFNTASNALAAAKKIQEACRADADFQLRIGIHLGEVVFENEDVFGDGVNIASRIESLGIAGAVLISKAIRDQVKNNSDFQLESLGHFDFKNVSEPIEVYALSNPGFAVPKQEEMQGKLKLPPKKSSALTWIIAIPVIAAASFSIWFFKDRKEPIDSVADQSIAVLAFVDMSQEKDQEYFSDGLSENVIDLLAKVNSLKVIGRTSSFSFKGKNEDLRVIGEKLGAANILEGSVQRDGNKIRITAQLIRSADGFHLWSEKYDRELKDIFAIQDEISLAILKAIKVKLIGQEKEALLKKYTDNVEAYQLYLHGRFHVNKSTPDGFMKAIEYFKAAIALDPNYSIAYSGMAFCYLSLWYWNWLPPEKSLPLGLQAAQKSLELDSNIAESHLAIGRVKLHNEWKVSEAKAEFNKALDINPNNAECHVQLSMCAALLGNNKEAMEHSQMAVRLDPFSQMNLWMATTAPYVIGDIETTLENGKRIIDLDSTFFAGHWWVGLSYMDSGKYQEGMDELTLAAKLENGLLTLSTLGTIYGQMGDKVKAMETINKMKSMKGIELAGNNFIGDVYVSIGKFDSAFLYYDKAVKIQEGFMLWKKYYLMSIPALQKDPRTRKLLDRIEANY